METTWQKNWQASKKYPKLEWDAKAEVVIIGGGITGITLAYLLSKAGKTVIILEKGTLREYSYTAYTTAMIMAQIDTSFPDLIKIFGKEKASAVWRLGLNAIDEIEKIVREEGIACEFSRVPGFIYANNNKEWQELKEEATLLASNNLPVERGEKKLKIPNAGYYVLSNQAKFHPLKYCDGLRLAAERHGAKFYENTKALEIIGGKEVSVLTKNGRVAADFVVVATYEPFNNPKELFARKGMYISYMCELSIPKNTLAEGLYVDSGNPYHYFRMDRGGESDRLILGGADHRKEIKINPEKNYSALLAYLNKILPGLKYKMETKWDGGILESVDGLPFIGPYSQEYPNRYLATAFSGNGMTYSMIAAKIISAHVAYGKYDGVNPFDPKRPLSAKGLLIKGKDYVKSSLAAPLKTSFSNNYPPASSQ